MSTDTFLRDLLFIPDHQQRYLSTDRLVCVVHDEWLHGLRLKVVKDVSKTRILSKADAALLLAPSHQILPKYWTRVCIKVIKKNSSLVSQLHNGPLYNTNKVSSGMEHLVQCCRENFRNMWASAHMQYNTDDMGVFPTSQDQLTNVLRSYIQRLNPGVYIKLPEDHDFSDLSSSNYSHNHGNHIGNNIIPTLAVIETPGAFFIVQKYLRCSLGDIVSYSPAVFNTSHAKSLFVLYQILHAMMAVHHLGLSYGELNLQNVKVDEKLWVSCTYPHISQIVGPGFCRNNESGDSTALHVDESGGDDVSSFKSTVISDHSIETRTSKHTMVANEHIQYSRLSESESSVEEAKDVIDQFHLLDIKMDHLSKLTEDWIGHKISNFRYLMVLNYLAGRRLGDPNHHPVLPWVIDFTSSGSGFRDLTMSKFRLNKGDSQLDFTYEAMSDTEHISHHVSDVLSDITYYVYKARRTPKHILCSYVRTKWVPNEYPLSIERMFQWTPDECIPEFYTDPTIFTSIHEDLPDLELPGWCSSATEFVDRHMAVLESEQVSCYLHHWIDLTFGYKLSGQSAVRSKNVYLHLVDQHKDLINCGVVQLFTQPHPNRLPSNKQLSLLPPRVTRKQSINGTGPFMTGDREPVRPESASIKLPADFDPVAALDHFESLHSFTSKTTETLPPSTVSGKTQTTKFSDIHDNMTLVWLDMQQFGCLMCELYLAPKLQAQKSRVSLHGRYNRIGRLCAKDRNNLPRMVHMAADVLLRLDDFRDISKGLDTNKNSGHSLLFEYPMINSLGLQPPTPALLIQPFSRIIPFPEYFAELYSMLNDLKNFDIDIEKMRWDLAKSKQERRKMEKVLSRKKVDLVEKYLRKNKGRISMEGYELILPYVKELFQDPKTTVQAAWSLLGLVGKDLGPKELGNSMLPYLTRLYSGEDSTPKHMKLYHRSFLVQLLLHLGLGTFLTNFCTLLVEAVAGYKDFVIDGDADMSQEDMEDEMDEDVFLSNQTQMEAVIETQEPGLNASEVNAEDIRPDQTEEDDIGEDEGDDGNSDVSDDDILGDEFPHLSVNTSALSPSGDSFSTDQVSQLSTESDSFHDDESVKTDRGSSDRASIHSISHIIEISQDRNPQSTHNHHCGDSCDDEEKGRQQPAVHFVMDQSDSEQSLSNQSKDFQIQNSQSKYSEKFEDQSNDSEEKKSSYMIRSETDEFRQIHYSHTINICDVSAESIKWLCHRLGPLLTAKYLSKNLVRMLALCYLGEEQIVPVSELDEDLPKTTRLIQGDRNASKVLECLSFVSTVYGEQVILLQYIPCIVDLIHVAKRRLTVRAEAGLVAAVVLLRHMVPLLADKTLLDVLQESIIPDALKPMLKLVSSMTTSFPSGFNVRSIVLYKTVDVLYIIGLRLGFENTRNFMTSILQTFFKPFAIVYAGDSINPLSGTGSSGDLLDVGSSARQKDNSSVDDSYLNIKIDAITHQYMIGSPVTVSMPSTSPTEHTRKGRTIKSNYSLTDNHTADDRDDMGDGRSATEENVLTEVIQTFSPELALAAYIPLTSIFGSHHMEEHLTNDDLIRRLCAQYDKALYTDNDGIDNGTYFGHKSTVDDPAKGDLGSNVAMVGNRICLQEEVKLSSSPETTQLRKHFEHKGILRIDPDETTCVINDFHRHRHLKGNWLAYWEHELGLNERDTMFNFKQIKLQTFIGHNNSIRSLACLDNENSFISASKDKTVKLWSLTSYGDGSGKCRFQWSYDQHKKSVFSVAYLETMRLVASCDSTVHIWDPFTGDPVRQLESARYSPVIALTPLPSPSRIVMTANTDSTLKFLDLRTARYAHEYKCGLGSPGMIRCITVSPDGSWAAVGFSSGIVSLVDLNTGILMGTWKAHDSEILQLKAFNKVSFVSSSFDLNMKLWSSENGKEICSFKGHLEPVHCVSFYKSQIVSATTNNKIGVHTSVDNEANFSATKLQSEVFKGVLTSMAILPLNRTLLLGADNGLIRLLC